MKKGVRKTPNTCPYPETTSVLPPHNLPLAFLRGFQPKTSASPRFPNRRLHCLRSLLAQKPKKSEAALLSLLSSSKKKKRENRGGPWGKGGSWGMKIAGWGSGIAGETGLGIIWKSRFRIHHNQHQFAKTTTTSRQQRSSSK